MSTPASCMKSAAQKCGAEPLPEVAKLSAPGDFFAAAIRSLIDMIGELALTTTTRGELPRSVTGSRFFA